MDFGLRLRAFAGEGGLFFFGGLAVLSGFARLLLFFGVLVAAVFDGGFLLAFFPCLGLPLLGVEALGEGAPP